MTKSKKCITPYSRYIIEKAIKPAKNSFPNTLGCTFLGSPCQQSFNSFFVWEKLLSHLSFERFIEIGTATGNTSIYFKLFCINKRARFYTFDFAKKNKMTNTPIQRYLKIKDDYIIQDVFKNSDEICKIIQRKGRSIIFCDGGDKPHELRIFGPSLKKGDIIACHDWGRAIKSTWVEDDIRKLNLKELYRKERVSLNTLVGIFKKR